MTWNTNRQLKKLQPRHLDILSAATRGASIQVLADEFKVHRDTISRVLNCDLGRQYMDALQDDLDRETIWMMVKVPFIAKLMNENE